MPSILSLSENYELEDDIEEETDEENDLPNGVFTLLTDCYSPTCTRDNLCYSIACPRRLEQVCIFHILQCKSIFCLKLHD
jgi:RHO1 GDP-GTP exchange protein 1/2